MNRLVQAGALLALLTPAAAAQSARPTVVVMPFTVNGLVKNRDAVAPVARRATLHLDTALTRDSSIQLLPRSVALRSRAPGGAPSGARYAVVAEVRETPRSTMMLHWQLLGIKEMKILAWDSLQIFPRRENDAAGVVAGRIAAALHP